MLQAFINMWRITELRNKLLFTLGMIAIYRIGYFVPLMGVDQESLRSFAERAAGGAMGNILSFVSMFTGGSLSQSTVFGLGIMPYISASIILQLLATVLPGLQALKKEGPAGQQKIIEWTRYLTVVLALIQGGFWLSVMQGQQLVYPEYQQWPGVAMFWVAGISGLTAGAVFLMWLGEQIDKYGIGNGASLIITAGIIARMPDAVIQVIANFDMRGAGTATYSPMTVVFLILSFIVVVAGAIIITQGQRRIPIQQAKHTRGRRVYGGQKTYLPLRVNHGGVMPIIFASSLMMFPSIIIGMLDRSARAGGWWTWLQQFFDFLSRNMDATAFLYLLMYIGLIYFFAYFWTTVQFQPKEMATQLRDHGSFIPGLRPGPRTAEYLETVMERITYVGAGFLAVIAVVPTIVSGMFGIPYNVSSFLGGTGLLIVVSVMLDFVQRIEANLLMRNYQGFLSTGGSGRGPRIRGASGMV
ncbi:MAG: preprotein translocase subunit SecY [Phycisphaeraceae bacterium]